MSEGFHLRPWVASDQEGAMVRQAHTYLAGAVSGTALIAAAVVAFVMLVSLQALKDWPLAGIGGDDDSSAVSTGRRRRGGSGPRRRRGRRRRVAGRRRRERQRCPPGGRAGRQPPAGRWRGTPALGIRRPRPAHHAAKPPRQPDPWRRLSRAHRPQPASTARAGGSGGGGGAGGRCSGAAGAGGSGGGALRHRPLARSPAPSTTPSPASTKTLGGALGETGVTKVTEEVVNGVAGPESPVGETVDETS